MGGAAGTNRTGQQARHAGEDHLPDLECTLKGLPGAIEEALYVREKWPLIVDLDGQATRFLRYQQGALLFGDNRADVDRENLRAKLVASLMHGGNFCLVFESLTRANFEDLLDEEHFPEAVLDRRRVFLEETWKNLLRPDKGDPTPDLFDPRDGFKLIIVTGKEELPEEALPWMTVIRIRDGEQQADVDKEAQTDQELAGIFGATEVKRVSLAMVEAAFDGESEEVMKFLSKGYHIESSDGRGHTSISEAAAQGHGDLIRMLLAEGANPNALNDSGRSALWRASYNGHVGAVELLLGAGADPSFRDKVSHDGPYDVAKTDEVRAVLDAWDPEVTMRLCEERKQQMRARAEERLTTAAERDRLARSIIRDELIDKAVGGDAIGLKEQLIELADDADRTGQRPRGTCEVRDPRGMTLLSLAAQHGRLDVMELLLTHSKTCDDGKIGLTPGTSSWECRVMKANPNSRDLKGWNPAAIAVFHESKAALKLLLNHGADPYLRSSYNKSAWDMAQDDFDAAGRVVRSRAEIRGVIDAWAIEARHHHQTHMLVGGSECNPLIGEDGVPIGLPKDGTATMLAIEVAQGTKAPPKKRGGKGKISAKKPPAKKK